MTVKEMAALLGITPQWVKIWNRHGLICGHACNDKNDCLYEHPGDNPPVPTKKSVDTEIVAFTEARPVTFPHHGHSTLLSARLFPSPRRSASRDSCFRHQLLVLQRSSGGHKPEDLGDCRGLASELLG
jgi:hypothetical protein